MSTSDLLVVIDANLQQNIFFPSKLADYLGSGRDILAITPEGPTEDILKETGGTSIRHQNVRRLADVLRDKITSSSKKSEPSMKSRQRFAARNVVNHFDEIMKNIDETG